MKVQMISKTAINFNIVCWDIVEMIFGWLVTNTNDNLVIDFGPETLSIYTPYRAMAADN